MEKAHVVGVAGVAGADTTLAARVFHKRTGHHLYLDTQFNSPTYCNRCNGLLWGLSMQGVRCVICREVLHRKCLAAQGQVRTCRFSYWESSPDYTVHHWVFGNLHMNSRCVVCEKKVGMSAASRCSWCAVKIHDKCQPMYVEQCYGGELGQGVVLPSEVWVQPKEGLNLEVEQCCNAQLDVTFHFADDKTPLLIFINCKSGGQQGEDVFRWFCSYLNELQVRDLGVEGSPTPGLLAFKDVPNLRVVACGGDGTFGWIMNAMDDIMWPGERPAVAHFPLGTGNDMARSLGWGPGYTGEHIKPIIKSLLNSSVSYLDRWEVKFNGEHHGYVPVMNNYFEIGINAKVAHKFHTQRESHPEKFTNRTWNKVKYVGWGATSNFRGLSKKVKIFCDGIEIPLSPNCQAITVLNLPTYAGGMKLWAPSDDSELFHPADISDGRLEIVELKGSQDIGLAAIGIKPTPLAQAKRIQIETSEELPVLIDGEPWMQEACHIEIVLKNKVAVLGQPNTAVARLTPVVAHNNNDNGHDNNGINGVVVENSINI